MQDRPLTTPEARLASLAARLLGLSMQTAQAGSDPEKVIEAGCLHDEKRLYPRLILAAPHGGGAVRLELALCDPASDAPVLSMLTIEAQAEEATWN